MAAFSMRLYLPSATRYYSGSQHESLGTDVRCRRLGTVSSESVVKRVSRTSSAIQRRQLAITGGIGSAQKLLQTGKIRAIEPKDAASLLKEGYRVLDVRPQHEYQLAHGSNFVHVPLFVEDTGTSPATVFKRGIQMSFSGFFSGQRLTKRNEAFVDGVVAALPDRSAKILICCQEGLRSLVAAEELLDAGYSNLAWMNGGFNVSEDGDFPDDVVGESSLKYASRGGYLGLAMRAAEMAQGAAANIIGKN